MCYESRRFVLQPRSPPDARNHREAMQIRMVWEGWHGPCDGQSAMKTVYLTFWTILWVMIASLSLGETQEATGGAEVSQKPGWFRRTFGALTWDEVAQVVESPKEICAKVRHHIKSGEEGPSAAIMSGKKAWDRGTGDCKDYAACVVELCVKIGAEASVMVFYPKGGWVGHAVVVGRWKGKVWMSSNGWYETVDSLEEAKVIISRECGWRGQEIIVSTLEDAENKASVDIQGPVPFLASKTLKRKNAGTREEVLK